MPPSDRLTMEAGRELDALIAEKLFGWKVRWDAMPPEGFDHAVEVWAPGWEADKPARYAWCDEWPQTCASLPAGAVSLPTYSTNIAAAWQVVEAFRARGPRFWWSLETAGWNVLDAQGVRLFEGSVAIADGGANTMPLAICRAALAALETTDAP